ncbi:MAG: hypothetical protein IT461_16925 [Planctomycetes bacterium]|nr:hypothetical protein [Planctomycetota bacterium]
MLNLKYGQQAVSRGYVTPQRLQQVLAKQRQLADQGKKVSVRMILEKSKLLTPDQLDQLDRDLNIKVVKKKTSTINKAALQQRQPQKAVQSVSADNFMGDEALPDVSGTKDANPDATIYSPPPPDMQERIRQEREKAKAAVRQKQDAQAGRPAPAQPQRPAAPQRPQPQPAFAEPMMEPEMEPEPFGEAAPELERMDSSPKLESLPAEYHGIAAPEDEALPTLDGGGFDQIGEQPQQGGFDNLAPAEQGFDQFGEQGGMSGTAALGAEPEQGNWGEEPQAPSFDDGGAAPMDATMYSPPPPQYQPQAEPEAPEMQPQGFDNFGEDDAPAAPAFGDVGEPASMDATLYSPPPSAMPQAEPEAMPEPEVEPEMAEPSFGEESPAFGEPEPVAPPEPVKPAVSGRKLPPGKKLVDDFAGTESDNAPKQPAGLDDVPTVKPRGEPVHPLRRGVSSEINALDSKQPTSKRVEAGRPEPVKADAPKPGSGKLPKKAAEPEQDLSVDLPEEAPEPAMVAPTKPPRGEAKKAEQPSKPESKKPKSAPAAAPQPAAADDDGAKKKKGKLRMLLTFVFMLFLVAAILILPVVPQMQSQYPFLGQMRRNEHTRQLYDYVENWANQVRKMVDPGAQDWKTGVTPIKPAVDGVPPEDKKSEEPPKEEPKEQPKEEPKEQPKEEPKADVEAQWKALYKAGASWVMRMNYGMEMWQKTEVISVDGTKARVKVSTKMKAEDEFANAMESDVEYKAQAAGAGEPDPKYKELAKGQEKVREWDTDWLESEYDGAKTKMWTTSKFGNWLIVKMETAQGSMELLEFIEGK